MLTVMTTIGYGTFAPSTDAGKVIVVTFGSIAMIVCGACLGAISNEIDGFIERGAKQLLRRVESVEQRLSATARARSRQEQNARADGRLIHCKMAVALGVMHCALILGGATASAASLYFNGEAWDFGTCYYFCFVTFSTIGFGDYAFGPKTPSGDSLFLLHVQVRHTPNSASLLFPPCPSSSRLFSFLFFPPDPAYSFLFPPLTSSLSVTRVGILCLLWTRHFQLLCLYAWRVAASGRRGSTCVRD